MMLTKLKSSIFRAGMKTLKSFDKGVSNDTIRFTICEQQLELASIIAETFANVPAVEVLQGNLLNLQAEALVSPANSFGEMSGGLDKAIDNFYNGEAQSRAMSHIREKYYGELPVGTAAVLKMDQRQFPKLILVPTMRVPGKLSKESINAYLAMRALCIAVLDWNKEQDEQIQSVVMSSLCTGVGRMPYKEAAEQMLVGYAMIMDAEWENIIHPALAAYANRII